MNPIYEGVNGVNEQYEIEADSTEMKLSDEYIAKTKTKIIYINDKLSSSFFNDVVFSIKIEDNSQIEAIIEELTEQKNFFPSISNLYYENGKIHYKTDCQDKEEACTIAKKILKSSPLGATGLISQLA